MTDPAKKRRKPKLPKERYNLVSHESLRRRAEQLQKGGWPVSKWIIFCRDCLDLGLDVGVYEAQTTRSKYVYVLDKARAKRLKVRFSNHRPNEHTQLAADSDFYVGVSNGLVTTTADAMKEVHRVFEIATA